MRRTDNWHPIKRFFTFSIRLKTEGLAMTQGASSMIFWCLLCTEQSSREGDGVPLLVPHELHLQVAGRLRQFHDENRGPLAPRASPENKKPQLAYRLVKLEHVLISTNASLSSHA